MDGGGPGPAARAGPGIREDFIPVTGGRVWYRIVGADKPAAPPHDYLEPLVALAHERQVIFYDQLSCGNSERPGFTSLYTIKRFVTELAQVRAYLKTACIFWGSPGGACWPLSIC